MTKEQIADQFKALQDTITQTIESTDGNARFKEDIWQREGGGGGRSRVIAKAQIIEKGGVNFSAVHGSLPDKIKTKLKVKSDEFFATGVSLIMHPENPHVPIVHMNIRYFELKDGTYWFGGGIDLTPIYIDKKEAADFHQALKLVCDKYHPEFYQKFKTWADDYFYLSHRDETRGIGGIFFDHLNESEGLTKDELFSFVIEIGQLFAPLYAAIMKKKANSPYSEQEKDWQLHRRGRYVEFNLLQDKGTRFGIDTNGRAESILVSMPPEVKWTYQYEIKANSPEANTISQLKKGTNWLQYL
ncbi:oxygen-dependent coproporphyrinogen oxidase [Ancylomarina euxinus]|uniref:coproporphyrinogen oxidase n=1 Tax=Ancylomarina euxinus TaxID=2283627 RepID=A0A425Y5F6_9BACT|nr:oxygen-dependent coproporphyrinogen oxidase [Ancylomarina euxinus]MCZ4694271.1 oxygen-dependent coproporphyrinogen oxidase [Ancylomarina euxinus]MUP14397.1 oxygen-dependent coproporphyrinogen oxidase [Ancylomarina euxinus]RRG23707.1 oxygen-dependent coproporphyrinogen oxidase [Ancylomarina euxinus]